VRPLASAALLAIGCIAAPGSGAGVDTGESAASLPQVRSGRSHTCALDPDGEPWCWGEGSAPPDPSLNVPNFDYGQGRLPAGPRAALEVGADHTCWLDGDGALGCVGGDPGLRGLPSGTGWVGLSVGGWHGCVWRDDGAPTCWGNPNGDDPRAGFDLTAPPAGPYTAMDGGGWHHCGLGADGALACWGYAEDGALAAPAGPWLQVSAGARQTCALDLAGAVWCWGRARGAPPAGSFVQVTAGEDHACALSAAGGGDLLGEPRRRPDEPAPRAVRPPVRRVVPHLRRDRGGRDPVLGGVGLRSGRRPRRRRRLVSSGNEAQGATDVASAPVVQRSSPGSGVSQPSQNARR
jgi:hypothetical protein